MYNEVFYNLADEIVRGQTLILWYDIITMTIIGINAGYKIFKLAGLLNLKLNQMWAICVKTEKGWQRQVITTEHFMKQLRGQL